VLRIGDFLIVIALAGGAAATPAAVEEAMAG
jgi:hypothetical protein